MKKRLLTTTMIAMLCVGLTSCDGITIQIGGTSSDHTEVSSTASPSTTEANISDAEIPDEAPNVTPIAKKKASTKTKKAKQKESISVDSFTDFKDFLEAGLFPSCCKTHTTPALEDALGTKTGEGLGGHYLSADDMYDFSNDTISLSAAISEDYYEIMFGDDFSAFTIFGASCDMTTREVKQAFLDSGLVEEKGTSTDYDSNHFKTPYGNSYVYYSKTTDNVFIYFVYKD